MALDDASQHVISALGALQAHSDRQSQATANEWLSTFQHSRDAWGTCHALLFSDEVGLDVKMFAGQTFRAKVTYDLSELDSPSLVSLRTSLLSALRLYSAPGMRPILVQVCLALADLAVQMAEWDNVVQGLIDEFGKDVQMVPALLELLRVLPEEAANPKIAMANEEMSRRCSYLLSSSAEQVLSLLSMYIDAPGVDAKIQTTTFETLRSWLIAGELMASQIAQTPLFPFIFKALDSDQLFDTAVDVLVDLIHETQEIDDNLDVIQLLLPRIIALQPRLVLEEVKEDPDAMRGLCRIFVEAGETYRRLILQHPETFFPIVQAIATCSAYPDLEIVRITFNFWYRLAHSLGKRPADAFSQPFHEVYAGLLDIIITHLRFPANPDDMVAAERDEFRAFRHTMGDTLKDCCFVLGSTVCLKRSYDLIKAALESAANDPSSTVSWQAIEAPLFSMRSMGAEIDVTDNEVVPLIMELMPSLPAQPNVRYAAILVIGRYTEWIDCHPEHLEFSLQYVSSGFEDQDAEVAAAAAQSMRYLCKDCKRHLAPYLPQLHSFLTNVGPRLAADDVIQVIEAIAFVLSGMPVEEAAAGLRTFTMPLIQKVHEISVKQGDVSRDELQSVAVALEQLETFLAVLRTFGSAMPTSCASTPVEVWTVMDTLLQRFGSDWMIAERVCALIRRGLTFFDLNAKPIALPLLERMASCFETSRISGYIWIAGKVGQTFCAEGAGDESGEVARKLLSTWERQTIALAHVLENQAHTEIPDVLDDYVHLMLAVVPVIPALVIPSPAFAQSFSVCLTALNLPAPEIILTTLEYIQVVLSDPSINPSVPLVSGNGSTPPPSAALGPSDKAVVTESLRNVLGQQGGALVGLVLSGLVTGYPEEAPELVVNILRALAGAFPGEMVAWLPPVVESLPATSVPVAEKQAFLTKFGSALETSNGDLVKAAIIGLYRASRRTRERLRQGGRLSVGGDGR